MEKEIKIKLADEKQLYGKLNGSLRRPLVIMVHGFPGDMDEPFYSEAARWFYKKGFSTFRFNLYSYQKDARQLIDCTLQIYGIDIDMIIRYFRKRHVKKIFIIGHSFGGPAILSSKGQDFDGAVFWDPSYNISFKKSLKDLPGGKYIKEVDGYLMHWGISVVIGKTMVNEVENFSWDLMARKFKAPLKIIIAGKGVLHSAKNYTKSGAAPRGLLIVKKATHYFSDSPDIREQVFRASKNWFDKYI